jgi:hypothetical protein
LVTDLFEKITIYDNKLVSASYEPLNRNKYLVSIEISTHKFYADSIGIETDQPLNDYIPVGVFDKSGEEIYYNKHKFQKNNTIIKLVVEKEPNKAGIDPYFILIDRDNSNNISVIEKI